MKITIKILLLTLCFLQLQCYGQTVKEVKKTKGERVSVKQNVEVFKLEKPLNKTKGDLDKAIYNDYEVVLNSNPNNQKLTFIKIK